MPETITREQEDAIERLSLAHNGQPIHVRAGYADRHVEATLITGRCWHVNEDGIIRLRNGNFSIDWSELR